MRFKNGCSFAFQPSCHDSRPDAKKRRSPRRRDRGALSAKPQSAIDFIKPNLKQVWQSFAKSRTIDIKRPIRARIRAIPWFDRLYRQSLPARVNT
jgi:hypothetical protein